MVIEQFLIVLGPVIALVLGHWLGSRQQQRRITRRFLSMLDTLGSHASTAFVAWSARDGVAAWNPRAEQLFGLPREQALGHGLPAGLATLQRMADAADATGELREHRVELRHGDGSALDTTVSISTLPAPRGGVLHVAAVDCLNAQAPDAQWVEAARTQRDALVREVHHRIKNSLQGVAGLLRQHLSDKPLLKPLLEAASSQVSTIAAVHGLHGEAKGGLINLRMLVARVAASVSGIMHVPIVLTERCTVLEAYTVNEEESVPVAMVLNELIMNAVKHRPRSGPNGMITIDASQREQEAEIRISNPGFLPSNFDLGAGLKVGNGLGLIRSLLPRRGANMDLVEADGCVIASLVLRAPEVLGVRSRAQEVVA